MEKRNILIDNALNIKHRRFKNECLIYLGVKEPIPNFEWTMPPDEYSILDITNFFEDSDNIHLDTITFSIKVDNKKSYPIKIINNTNFPFKPFSVLLNNSEYYPNMLKNISLINNKYFKEVFENKCMCCETLLCNGNWIGPRIGFKHILNEIYDIIQKINICKELIFCDKIVDKYFGHYLPIREFIHP